MSDLWWDLPGPSAFVGEILDDFVGGRNVVLRLPGQAPPNLREAIRRRLERSDLFEWRTVELDADREEPPAERLLDELAPQELDGRTVTERTVAECDGACGNVVWFQGMTAHAWQRGGDPSSNGTPTRAASVLRSIGCA